MVNTRSATIDENSSWHRLLIDVLDIPPKGITYHALEQHHYVSFKDVYTIYDPDHFTNSFSFVASGAGIGVGCGRGWSRSEGAE